MIESRELQEYIMAVKQAIRLSGGEDFEDFFITKPIKLDIATTTIKGDKSKIFIKIAGKDTEVKTELVSRIQIEFYYIDPNKPKIKAGYV
jgi:hypothetical protein